MGLGQLDVHFKDMNLIHTLQFSLKWNIDVNIKGKAMNIWMNLCSLTLGSERPSGVMGMWYVHLLDCGFTVCMTPKSQPTEGSPLGRRWVSPSCSCTCTYSEPSRSANILWHCLIWYSLQISGGALIIPIEYMGKVSLGEVRQLSQGLIVKMSSCREIHPDTCLEATLQSLSSGQILSQGEQRAPSKGCPPWPASAVRAKNCHGNDRRQMTYSSVAFSPIFRAVVWVLYLSPTLQCSSPKHRTFHTLERNLPGHRTFSTYNWDSPRQTQMVGHPKFTTSLWT